MEKQESHQRPEVYLGEPDVHADSLGLIRESLEEVCAEYADGYTEFAACSPTLALGDDRTIKEIYATFFDLPKAIMEPRLFYKLVSEYDQEKGHAIAKPYVVITGFEPSTDPDKVQPKQVSVTRDLSSGEHALSEDNIEHHLELLDLIEKLGR